MAKVAIADERENALHQRSPSPGVTVKPQLFSFSEASDLPMVGADKNRWPTSGGDAVDLLGTIRPSNLGLRLTKCTSATAKVSPKRPFG